MAEIRNGFSAEEQEEFFQLDRCPCCPKPKVLKVTSPEERAAKGLCLKCAGPLSPEGACYYYPCNEPEVVNA